MKRKIGILTLGLIAFVGGSLAFAAQADEGLTSRLERLERDINSLQRQVYRGERVAVPASSQITGARGEGKGLSARDYLEIKLGEMEKQMGLLTGEIEALQHRLGVLESKNDRINADANQRFTELEDKIMAVKRLESETAAKAETEKEPAPKAEEVKLSPKEEYAKAYALMEKKEFVSAAKAFKDFIAQYPEEELAGNAQYWLGETYYARKKYEEAVVAFAEGYEKYPANNKAPDNFFKLGMTMVMLGKKDEACTVFGEYEKQFPNAAENFKKRAKKEAEKLKCK